MTEKIIVFTCNWDAYSSLESAGAEHLTITPTTYPVRVTCLGQLSPGLVLKAFEKGAAGVLMLGCAPGACHYRFGNQKAEEVYAEVKRLISLLGYQSKQLELDWLPASNGAAFVEKVQHFTAALNGRQRQP